MERHLQAFTMYASKSRLLLLKGTTIIEAQNGMFIGFSFFSRAAFWYISLSRDIEETLSAAGLVASCFKMPVILGINFTASYHP